MVLKGRVLNSFKESETPYHWKIRREALLNCTTANFCCTGKSILVIDGNSTDSIVILK
jgi:hypothetical protein